MIGEGEFDDVVATGEFLVFISGNRVEVESNKVFLLGCASSTAATATGFVIASGTVE